jgi:TolB protein
VEIGGAALFFSAPEKNDITPKEGYVIKNIRHGYNSILLFAFIFFLITGCGSYRVPSSPLSTPTVPLPTDNFTNLQRIIDHPSDDKYPEVSPGGSLVVYAAKKSRTWDVFYFNPRDKRINVTQVTKHVADDYDPTWSRDGKHIYFTSGRLNTLSIWKVKVMGGRGLNQITLRENVDDFNPNISPDGKTMVFTSINQTNSNFFNANRHDPSLWVSTPDGYKVVQIGEGNNPKWSPDGKRILFHAETGDNYDVWYINADGTNLTQLTTDSGDDKDACWPPDGNMVVFSSNREGTFSVKKNYDIWAIDLNSNGITQLTFDPADDGAPYWAKDGTIYFHSNRGTKDGTYDIFAGQPIIDWN